MTSGANESTSSPPDFLGLQSSDFQLIERYLGCLEADAPALARAFYDYLLAYPVTAAVFRDFSRIRLDALLQKQAEHIRGLLVSHLDESWQVLRLSLFQNQRSELSRFPLEGLWETVPG